MAETTTLPELGPIASDIKSRLVALETGASGDYVTTAQLDTALEGKLDKTGIATAATKASQDSDGNNIKSTYATKTELNTKQDKGDYLTTGTANTTYLKKADAQTTYLGISAKATSAATADSATKATQDASGNVITDTYLTKTAAATTYLGISSKAKSAETADAATSAQNAVNAANATKATQDGDGNNIVDTYAKKTDLPVITSGTNDLTAGESELATGNLYFVYE